VSDRFDAETLLLLDAADEIRIETRRNADAPEHHTIIWVVVVDDEVYVRSVRGPKGRWYREISSNHEGALHVNDRRIPVRAIPATDGPTVESVSEAYRNKYEGRWPGPTAAMVRPDALPTTLRLGPA
jgi:hypothetical protein